MFVQLDGVCGRPGYFNPQYVAAFYSAKFMGNESCTLILMATGKKFYVKNDRDDVARKFDEVNITCQS